MTIVLDQVLGGNVNDASSSSIAQVTGAAVAVGGFIIIGFCCQPALSVSSVTGGGLTYTVDIQDNSQFVRFGIISAQAPAGLASGTTITINFSGASAARGIDIISLTGVKSTGTVVDVTKTIVSNVASDLNWSTGNVTLAAGSVLISMNVVDGAFTSTIIGPSVEDIDQNAGVGSFSNQLNHRIGTTAGTYTVAGAYNANCTWYLLGAAYLAQPIVTPAITPDISRFPKYLLAGRRTV
jgi:hypothetical protein